MIELGQQFLRLPKHARITVVENAAEASFIQDQPAFEIHIRNADGRWRQFGDLDDDLRMIYITRACTMLAAAFSLFPEELLKDFK